MKLTIISQVKQKEKQSQINWIKLNKTKIHLKQNLNQRDMKSPDCKKGCTKKGCTRLHSGEFLENSCSKNSEI